VMCNSFTCRHNHHQQQQLHAYAPTQLRCCCHGISCAHCRRRFWLWWCDGLTVRDALVVAVWATYNAVWYFTILGKALSRLPPGMQPSPRLVAKSFASLMMPNLVPLLMPVSR
jgi:hypothetical protein